MQAPLTRLRLTTVALLSKIIGEPQSPTVLESKSQTLMTIAPNPLDRSSPSLEMLTYVIEDIKEEGANGHADTGGSSSQPSSSQGSTSGREKGQAREEAVRLIMDKSVESMDQFVGLARLSAFDKAITVLEGAIKDQHHPSGISSAVIKVMTEMGSSCLSASLGPGSPSFFHRVVSSIEDSMRKHPGIIGHPPVSKTLLKERTILPILEAAATRDPGAVLPLLQRQIYNVIDWFDDDRLKNLHSSNLPQTPNPELSTIKYI